MLFSVIIPTHNRAHQLRKCLESLTLQTYKNFEVIISDDGSTDETKSVVDEFRSQLNLHYLYQATPSGRAARPRNFAAAKAQGEWLCFLDSDDWWYPEKLATMIENLSGNDVLFHGLDTFDEQGKKSCRPQWGRKLKTPVFVDLMTGHNALITSATLLRRSVFEKVHGFCEIDLEDYDLWLRVSLVTDRFTFLPRILGGYWAGGGNTTQISQVEISRLEKIFEKHKGHLTAEQSQEAKLALDFIKARILHKMGQKSEARSLYWNCLKSHHPRIRIRALFFSALSLLS